MSVKVVSVTQFLLRRYFGDVDSFCLVVFIFVNGFFRLLVLNIVTSLFVQFTLQDNRQDDLLRLQTQIEEAELFVGRLVAACGTDKVGFEEFSHFIEGDMVLDVFRALEVRPADAEKLFWELSAAGTQNVDLLTFLRGSVMMNQNATKLDLVSLVNLDVAKAHLHILFFPDVSAFIMVLTVGVFHVFGLVSSSGFSW